MDKRWIIDVSSHGEWIPKKISGLSSGRRQEGTVAKKREEKFQLSENYGHIFVVQI